MGGRKDQGRRGGTKGLIRVVVDGDVVDHDRTLESEIGSLIASIDKVTLA